jgi:hypothetical protein
LSIVLSALSLSNFADALAGANSLRGCNASEKNVSPPTGVTALMVRLRLAPTKADTLLKPENS